MVPAEADHDGGQGKLLRQAGGSDADDPLVPLVAGQDDGAGGVLPLQLGEGVVPDLGLDVLPLTVELAELGGERRGLGGICCHQKIRSLGGLAKTTRRVEAGRQTEADAGGGDPGGIHAGFLQHGGKAGPGRAGEHLQPTADQIAVFAHQRHHIRHGAHGHQIRIAAEHGLSIPLAGADQLHGHAHARQIRVGIAVPGLLAVDHGDGVRQRVGLALVVIGDDHVHADGLGVLGLLQGGDAAVHGDEQTDPFCPETVQRGTVEAVAFLVAVGNIAHALEALAAQIVGDQTGGGDAVHIIVAINSDRLLLLDGASQAPDSLGHALHLHGIMQTGKPTVQQLPGLRQSADAAKRQYSRKKRPAARLFQLIRNIRP